MIDLDHPRERKLFFGLPSKSKADVGLLQWNPHMARSSFVACVLNDSVQIWDLASVTDTRHSGDILQQLDSSGSGAHHIITGESPPPPPLLSSLSSPSTMSVVLQFRAHKRPVTDIGWSYEDPNLLATCSSDEHLCIWDIRT